MSPDLPGRLGHPDLELRNDPRAHPRTIDAFGSGRTVDGTCHAGDMIFVDAMPDVYETTRGDIKRFIDSL